MKGLRSQTCWLPLLAVAVLASSDRPSRAIEHVLVNLDGRQRQLSGRVLVEDPAGGMLLETDDGAMWPIEAHTIRSRTSDAEPLVPLDKDQLGKRLLEEMGPAFQVHDSKNYVVVFNTTRTYAQWCSSLLERLQRAFIAYWKKKGCDVHEPSAPLAVLVFSDKASYLRHAKEELGDGAGNAIGYYSFQTNRIVMYDLTGMQELRRENGRRGSLHDITALLSQPQAEPLVATIVHEATHQISFNCGLQTRYNFPPVWLSEGLAVYFETPDLSGSRSWGGIGKVNYSRWDRYRNQVQTGQTIRLRNMILDDELFREPRTAVDSYAAAWAWNYFLIRWKPKEYAAYLKDLAEKPRLVLDDKATRMADFQKHFGKDMDSLEEEFYRNMSRIK
ncbi:MAG: DUF1570 domain-containing protein [Planctomycetales bacterium]|nr:DUF1570 domain-containing protein [Planctomycetales bacterium]